MLRVAQQAFPSFSIRRKGIIIRNLSYCAAIVRGDPLPCYVHGNGSNHIIMNGGGSAFGDIPIRTPVYDPSLPTIGISDPFLEEMRRLAEANGLTPTDEPSLGFASSWTMRGLCCLQESTSLGWGDAALVLGFVSRLMTIGPQVALRDRMARIERHREELEKLKPSIEESNWQQTSDSRERERRHKKKQKYDDYVLKKSLGTPMLSYTLPLAGMLWHANTRNVFNTLRSYPDVYPDFCTEPFLMVSSLATTEPLLYWGLASMTLIQGAIHYLRYRKSIALGRGGSKLTKKKKEMSQDDDDREMENAKPKKIWGAISVGGLELQWYTATFIAMAGAALHYAAFSKVSAGLMLYMMASSLTGLISVILMRPPNIHGRKIRNIVSSKLSWMSRKPHKNASAAKKTEQVATTTHSKLRPRFGYGHSNKASAAEEKKKTLPIYAASLLNRTMEVHYNKRDTAIGKKATDGRVVGSREGGRPI